MKRIAWLVAAVAAAVIGAQPALAQGPGGNGSLKFRLGGYLPSADGGFWDFQQDVFAIDQSDFNDAMFGATWAIPLNNNLEIGFNIDFYDGAVRVADQDFTDEFGNSILHDASLELVPITADLRWLPGGRYTRHGKLTARKPVPYLGAGVGLNYWEYEEQGDFVYFDLTDAPFVAFDRYKDSGTAFETHVLAGLEIPVSPSWNLTFEGRYSWSKVSTDSYATSEGYATDDMDIGGLALFFGASVQF